MTLRPPFLPASQKPIKNTFKDARALLSAFYFCSLFLILATGSPGGSVPSLSAPPARASSRSPSRLDPMDWEPSSGLVPPQPGSPASSRWGPRSRGRPRPLPPGHRDPRGDTPHPWTQRPRATPLNHEPWTPTPRLPSAPAAPEGTLPLPDGGHGPDAGTRAAPLHPGSGSEMGAGGEAGGGGRGTHLSRAPRRGPTAGLREERG